jgi:hypothetical protein
LHTQLELLSQKLLSHVQQTHDKTEQLQQENADLKGQLQHAKEERDALKHILQSA